ncbi:hypothetical protein LTR85_002693 [Meristemomyces frigidus]|nr:hypothetical protein LTR85_002693 [Meristemomyces frigidus]
MASAPLLDLAADIVKNATVVREFLTQAGHSQPSFSPDGPAKFPADAGEDVVAARTQLIYAARQLQLLVLGPTESLQWFALTGALDTATLRWLYHFDVPTSVPKDGSITFVELALKLKVSQRTLTRILRHAMTNNIFREPSFGSVAHTSLSLRLAEEGNSIRGVVGHQMETVFPAVSRMVEAHEKYGTDDDCATHAPFHVAFDTEMRALDWVAGDLVRSARFTESMKGGASTGPFSTAHTVSGFDWKGLGEAVVVDVGIFTSVRSVGGSAGQVSKAIAASAPKLRFVIQDQPSMVAEGEAELEDSLQDRFVFQHHDLFEKNPETALAVFLLRLILHDWPDRDAVVILRQVVRKMGPTTRLLINDAVVPVPGSVHPLQEKYIRNVDMMMLSMLNGLERTRKDWEALIEETDPGLRIVSIVKPQGSALSMIEVARGCRR